jgi:hypothetical protein
MAASALCNKLIPANEGRKNPRVRVPEPARAKVQHAGGQTAWRRVVGLVNVIPCDQDVFLL